MTHSKIGLRERFLGCLLGHAVGDAFGAPFEGTPADAIYRSFGPIRPLIEDPSEETYFYTDDTQMTIGVAEALIADGEIRQETLAQAFGRNFHPGRCYGPGTRKILHAMHEGRDWQTMASTLLPGGSFGNGAAMRVAPVALLFWQDEAKLIEQAAQSALPTHRHPLGIEGAMMEALAIAWAIAHEEFDHHSFYNYLIAHAASEEFATALEFAERLTPDDTLGRLGNSLEAHRSVPTAIASFALNPNSYEDTISRAIALGGDTDTLAAMAGAISGARLGLRAIPRQLLDRLENGKQGRDYIISLADQLWEAYEKQQAIPTDDAPLPGQPSPTPST